MTTSNKELEALLSPKVLEAAARQIEPHLGCWSDNAGDAWAWRKGQEIKHAERIMRAAIAALQGGVEFSVRGMTAPCEHGILDFEQCPECAEQGGGE